MLTHPFHPHAEIIALYDALTLFRERWEQQCTMPALFDLYDAIDRADDVCTELRQGQLTPQSDLDRVASKLQLLLVVARNELKRVQEETLEEIGHRMAAEERRSTVSSPSTVLPAGTILSCPQCEKGLYKVTARASIDDLVLD